MITKQIALTFVRGQILEHVSLLNADNTPLRCRVNGQCKVWKTQPDLFQVPVKHGFNKCFYISPDNAGQWVLKQ